MVCSSKYMTRLMHEDIRLRKLFSALILIRKSKPSLEEAHVCRITLARWCHVCNDITIRLVWETDEVEVGGEECIDDHSVAVSDDTATSRVVVPRAEVSVESSSVCIVLELEGQYGGIA